MKKVTVLNRICWFSCICLVEIGKKKLSCVNHAENRKSNIHTFFKRLIFVMSGVHVFGEADCKSTNQVLEFNKFLSPVDLIDFR